MTSALGSTFTGSKAIPAYDANPDSTNVLRLQFKDKSGNPSFARAGNFRIKSPLGFADEIHYRMFQRPLQDSYACDQFVAATKYIYLDAAEGDKAFHFHYGDKFSVTGSASNNGYFTILASSYDTTTLRTLLTVSEAVVNEAAGSAGTGINTVLVTGDPDMYLRPSDTMKLNLGDGPIFEVHLMSAGAAGATLYLDAKSEMDISGTTLT